MEINKIYHQDCFEGMKQMIEEGMKVDLIVTDPPYILGGHKSDGVVIAQLPNEQKEWLKQ